MSAGPTIPAPSSSASDLLAEHLRSVSGLASAAVLVELDQRGNDAGPILEDVAYVRLPGRTGSAQVAWRTATRAIVDAWAGGADGCVLAALAAWEREGCEHCGEAVAVGTDHDGRCDECAEVL